MVTFQAAEGGVLVSSSNNTFFVPAYTASPLPIYFSAIGVTASLVGCAVLVQMYAKEYAVYVWPACAVLLFLALGRLYFVDRDAARLRSASDAFMAENNLLTLVNYIPNWGRQGKELANAIIASAALENVERPEFKKTASKGTKGKLKNINDAIDKLGEFYAQVDAIESGAPPWYKSQLEKIERETETSVVRSGLFFPLPKIIDPTQLWFEGKDVVEAARAPQNRVLRDLRDTI